MRDFIKYAFASALGTIVALSTLMVLLGMGAIGLIGVLVASSAEEAKKPEISEKSMLVFDLSTNIVDAVPYSGPGIVFEEAFSGESYRDVSLYAALKAIEAAAEDENIAGIYLTGNTSEGFATLQEVRAALSQFKETSGKPILAYANGWDERDYYLTSVADTVYLNPVGLLEMNGFRAEIQFLAGAFKKYGVGVQVLRAGRYKSAVEPFIRENSSPEDKQQTQAILSDLWQDFLNTVSGDRNLTPQQLQQLANAGGLMIAEDAKTAGLIDKVSFFDEVLTELQTLTDTDPEEIDLNEDLFPAITLSAYSDIVTGRSDGTPKDDAIAIVYAAGEIIMGNSNNLGLITSDGFARTLQQLRRDDETKAVVLRVNSPGGSALASEIIAHEVKLLAAEKPVIISMGDYAASGGYMISAPGTQIFASPNTLTGSIGVYGLVLNLKDIANRNGVTWDILKTAKFADINTISRPQTDEELKLQQDFVDDLYNRFVALVADNREVTPGRVNQVAQGRVWSGVDATQADLVDEMGGLKDAIAAAATTANLEKWHVEEYPQPVSLEEQILKSIFGNGAVTRLPWAKDPISQEVLKLREDLQILQTMDDPNGMYMRLPFTTEIE